MRASRIIVDMDVYSMKAPASPCHYCLVCWQLQPAQLQLVAAFCKVSAFSNAT